MQQILFLSAALPPLPNHLIPKSPLCFLRGLGLLQKWDVKANSGLQLWMHIRITWELLRNTDIWESPQVIVM